MRTLNTKEIISFIRKNSTLHNIYSNNYLRSKIYKCFTRNNIYYFLDKSELIGFIEWFRYNDTTKLIKDFTDNTVKDTHGKFLYISDYVFKNGLCKKNLIDRFLKFHKKLGEIEKAYIMKYKHGEFYIKPFSMGRS